MAGLQVRHFCFSIVGVARETGYESLTPKDAARRLLHLSIDDASAVFASGIQLLNADYPELVLPVAQTASQRHPHDARMHQLLGLSARATGESGIALTAFRRAAQLQPADALIAHSHARAALEAGQPAVALFDHAARLAPRDGFVLLGRIAALVSEQNSDRAVSDLAALVQNNPQWYDGHRTLARLRGQLGLDPTVSVENALASVPTDAALHRERIAIRLESHDLEGAWAAVVASQKTLGPQIWLEERAAHIASEQGDFALADRLFATLGHPTRIDQVAQMARHAIRAARPEQAEAVAAPWLSQDAERQLWPYMSLAWRMTDDPRWSWLEEHDNLVGVFDLADQIGDLAGLAEYLRGLHFARAAPLDQSVRGGTQTDGHLLHRNDVIVQNLREVLLRAVNRYVENLPAAVSGHPFLIANRSPLRFAGSWSVRLTDEGFHVDHVHSQGWISSALYIAVPENPHGSHGGLPQEGWLALGQSRDLAPHLDPLQCVEPRPGRLVLFPSIMWHGTRPFPKGERLSIAFDIARPRQGLIHE